MANSEPSIPSTFAAKKLKDKPKLNYPISPDASIVLDVRLGGSSRPLRFPLLCSVGDIIEIIRQIHPNHVQNNHSILATRSGIWLKKKRLLYTYYLEDLVCFGSSTTFFYL